MHTSRSHLAPLLAAVLVSPMASAEILWVDDDGGPGIDHTDIQSAIDAALPGDVIAVAAGVYSGFTLDLGLALVDLTASHGARVTGHVLVTGVPAPKVAVLASFELQSLEVSGCAGTVVLDNLDFEWTTGSPAGEALVRVVESPDVRMNQCAVDYDQVGDGEAAIAVASSRFELVSSTVRGRRGFYSGCTDAGDGGEGLRGDSSARISVFLSSVAGGSGGSTSDFCEWTDPEAGDGGHGILLRVDASALIAGRPSDLIEGGEGGDGDTYPTPGTHGSDGRGVLAVDASVLRWSGATIESMTISPSATAVQAVPPDPFLELFGTQQAGRELNFWVHGEPGAEAFLYLGRSPVVVDLPGQHQEQLTTVERLYTLGPLPPNGKRKVTLLLPAWLPVGFTFFAQGEVVLAGGEHRRTNSIPVVLRYLP